MSYLREAVDLFFSERFCPYRNVASVIGTLILLRLTFRLLTTWCAWTRAYFLAPWGIGRTNLKKYGSWAIVTGSSEGIGRGYALELAKQGLNVVLMSRSRDKLEKVADEIKEKYKREVRVLPTDFSRGKAIYPEIANRLKDLDIGILVNNVGFSLEYPDVFHDAPIDRMRNIIEINIQCMIHMCHLVIPKMVERKRGIVVNLSSAAAICPTVMLNVYGASKAFVEHFTEGLSLEYSGKGLVIQTVAPFFVATAMSGIRRSSLIVADAVQYSKAAVATIGIMNFTHGCLMHSIQGVFYRLLPQSMIVSGTWKAMKGARAKYLKKKPKSN